MRVVIAMDSFKHSLDAVSVTRAVLDGIKSFNNNIECECIPLADGGEGTLDTLIKASNGSYFKAEVEDPHGRKIIGKYGILGDKRTAIVEMAQASGIELLTVNERNPMKTTTRGTGELIIEALKNDIDKLILTIGGSATIDCGAGMASILGYEFKDNNGREVYPCGGELGKIADILIDKDRINRLKGCEFFVACDVKNELCGENGASYTYGPQKGADSQMVKLLDQNLKTFCVLIKEKLGIDISKIPGSGAAGGLGGGAIAFLNARMRPGFDLISRLLDIEEKIKLADLVITGEGMMDIQTTMGKTPSGVALLARKHGIPVIGICGKLGSGYEKLFEIGIDSIFSIVPGPVTLDDAIQNAYEYTKNTANRVIRLYCAKK
ncbi:glycerate kinase [bacterium]|nr:glycerate kinase [bacterium]